MKFVLKCFGVFLTVFLISACSSNNAQKKDDKKKKPNILFIAVDDLRPELNFYGANHIKSPNLDQLANESLVFNKAYCNIPVCGASRASLLTGMRPTRNRFITAHTSKDKQVPNAKSLPFLLKENGYTTISNGKIYHYNKDDVTAWDEMWQPDKLWSYALPESQEIRKNTKRGLPFEVAEVHDSVYRDGKLALKVIQDLKKLKQSNQPFFSNNGFNETTPSIYSPKKILGFI